MSRRGAPFQQVRGNRPGRSVFDMSYEYKTTCDMGQLIPVYVQECVPGDVWKLGNEVVIRFQPLVTPILHEINAFIHYWFVPNRIIWNLWESFITGGEDGLDASVMPRAGGGFAAGDLGDYLGFPLTVSNVGLEPSAFPIYCYNKIYNEYYRDENLIPKVNIAQSTVLRRSWEKDYFTSALKYQQKGTAPSLPISGTTHAVFPGDINALEYFGSDVAHYLEAGGTSTAVQLRRHDNSNINAGDQIIAKSLKGDLDNNIVDLSSATTFNVSDLRLAIQIQRWMELNNRGGTRYIESLLAHYGVAPRDERLQRPEYIGGSKTPVIVSEVLQTSATGLTGGTTALGGMAGHGLAVDRNFIGKYHCSEHGWIMGILSVMPRTVYSSQGIEREFLRYTKYDHFWPEFTGLSEQPVFTGELYSSSVQADNLSVFGYQGRYDEMRYKRSKFTGLFRSSPYYTWHLGRIFGSKPLLNQSFIECNPDKRIFAAPSEPGLIVNVGNKAIAIRPLPAIAEPGLMDHRGGI